MMLYLQTLLALCLVLGLVWLCYRLFLRLQNGLGLYSPHRRVEVLERTSLGDKRSLVLVRVGGREFLLGTTAGNVSLVSELHEPAPAKAPAQEKKSAPDNVSPFRRALREITT